MGERGGVRGRQTGGDDLFKTLGVDLSEQEEARRSFRLAASSSWCFEVWRRVDCEQTRQRIAAPCRAPRRSRQRTRGDDGNSRETVSERGVVRYTR